MVRWVHSISVRHLVLHLSYSKAVQFEQATSPSKEVEMKDKKSDKARKADRETAIKSELLNFRMPADRIRLIYEIAENNKVNVSTLLRDWINEKIDEESGSDSKPPTDEQIQFLSEALDALSERLRVLEGQAKSADKKPVISPKAKAKGAAKKGR